MITIKGAIVDIETTGLEGVGMGMITCAVVLPMTENPEPVIFRYDAYHCPLGMEKKLVRALLNHLQQYDILVGHNLRNFDYGYIRTRAVILDVPFPEHTPLYYDTLEGFNRTKFRTRLNQKGKPKASLDHVWDLFYGRTGKANPKTSIYPEQASLEVWGKGVLRKAAIDNKVAHCLADCFMTQEVFDKVFPADPKRGFKLLT